MKNGIDEEGRNYYSNYNSTGNASNHHEIYKTFWEELIACFPSIRHKPHRGGRVQIFCYFCLCIRCRGNVFTEPLPNNDKGNAQTHRPSQAWSFIHCVMTPDRWNSGSRIEGRC
jgi:hypothetical protein